MYILYIEQLVIHDENIKDLILRTFKSTNFEDLTDS